MKRLALLALATAALAQSAAGVLAAEEAASTNPLTPLGINSGLLFVQLFNFLLMAVILSVVLWRPMVNFLDARGEKIKRGLEDAAAAAKARQNAEAEAEKIRAEARAEVAKMLEEARARGEEVAKSIKAAADAAAEKTRADAAAEGKAAVEAQLAAMREQVIAVSVALANRIIGENLDAKKQTALVSDFFAKVPEAAKGLSGTVEVVTAMPLSDDEKKQAQASLGAAEVTFSVDPSILGGMIVRSADKVIDGSVRSNLNNLAARLN
jgi:F-type H+-transporting ATPase subunit b